jgi:hypothetical protein
MSSAPRGREPRPTGNAYIAVAVQEQTHLTDTYEDRGTLIRDLKASKADHLL